MGDIAALILAADRGVDFATAAALQVFRGRPLLQSSLERVGHWPVDRTVVVLGADEEEVMDTLDFGNCTVVIDPEWQEGSASPLRAGLDHLLREVGISTVILADVSQVVFDADVVGNLLTTADSERSWAVVAKYRYEWAMPYLIGIDLWPQLLGREGDAGIERLFKAHPDWVHEMYLDAPRPLTITHIEDLSAPRRS